MIYDCIVIGGGPAGLNAALVLGRAKLDVLVIDDEQPRNKVTQESHGFITNDGLSPIEIRAKANKDLMKYPSIQRVTDVVTDILPHELFTVKTTKDAFTTHRVIITTGLRETLPEITGLKTLYGRFFFNCPFCDGWEMKDKKLAVIVENNEDTILHFTQMIHHWSNHILVFTNGLYLSSSLKETLDKNQIAFYEHRIKSIKHEDLYCKFYLKNQEEVLTDGGFLMPTLDINLPFAQRLNLELDEFSCLKTDEMGKTSFENVYAAGDITSAFAAQLVHAASSGSKVASNIVKEIALSSFN